MQTLTQKDKTTRKAGPASSGSHTPSFCGQNDSVRSILRARRAPSSSNQVHRRFVTEIDMLSKEGEAPEAPHLDQASPAPAAPAAAGPARPTNLLQLLTSWSPGANRYGFQLKFRCRSTSGDDRDLQSQAPNLIWRENVSYSQNDFSHRINPPNPTILPPGGVSFAPANTTRRGQNLLEFDNVTDTHWMPTSTVRSGDFQPAGPRSLPAVMESRQTYQYSPDGGSSWRYFAGAFTIRRTLFRDGGNLKFRTQKTGVHTITENYKP